jgi:glycosyltransferase involved in cell wall biosynthesis
MKERKKILVFLSPSVGGAQRVTVLLSKMLDKLEYEVIFAVVGMAKSSIMDFLPQNATIKQIQIRNIYDFTTLKIIALMKRVKPYAVFCSQMYLNIRVIWAANWLGGIKVVIRSNAMVDNLKKTKTNFFMAKKTYKKADRIIAQSNAMKKEIMSVFHISSEKIKVIYNPVDKDLIVEKLKMPLPPKDLNETRFVCVGRVAPVKDYLTVIQSFNKIKAILKRPQLYLVGEYSETSEYYKLLKNVIVTNNLDDCIHFVGYTNNPFIWTKSADVFILSSIKEGLPNALIEAVYMGTPVVSTDCAEVVRKIIIDGVNGFIFKHGAVDELAEKMIEALSIKNMQETGLYVGASEQEVNSIFYF